MSKISEAQRKHFVNRIETKMNDVISGLKQKNAAEMTKQSQENLDDYLKAIDVLEDLESLRDLDKTREKVAERLKANCEKIQNILKEAGHISQYETKHYWDTDTAKTYEEHFRGFCNITCSQQSKTGISKEISILEAKRDEAVDFLYGISSENELTHGVAEILKGTGVKLIG